MNDLQPHMQFAYRRSPDQDAARPSRHAVVVIGAGPVGLALAIDLAQRGISCLLLDDNDRIGDGSRAICFAKRTLEVLDQLGVGETALAKGVQWQKGRVFHRDSELYAFDLLPEPGHKMPAFINLQQYYLEGYLAERALALSAIDLRWRNRVAGIEPTADGVRLTVDTPDGAYVIDADYVVACDGARSPARAMLGIDFRGEVFEDQFLIADVKMTAAFPTERWFWFDPPFHAGQSALLHKQPDDVWRIDLQLSPDADADHEKRPDIVRPRITRMLGHDDFDLEWISIYRFQCRRIDHFIHQRIIFAGDAAHQVSPFGARGANSGIQDAENLAWKLAAVLHHAAPATLLATYHLERSAAADENIAHSTRSTDFIAPQTDAERHLRDAALALASRVDFAKRMVNSGRLSAPTAYRNSPLSTPDVDRWAAGPAPGAAVPDAPLTDRAGRSMYLTEALGHRFALIVAGRAPQDMPPDVAVVSIGASGTHVDRDGLLTTRLDLTPGAAYLIRPDMHVAARFRAVTAATLEAALHRAMGHA